MSVEVSNGKVWAFRQRTFGTLPETPVHSVLRWVIEQLNYGNFVRLSDDDGKGVSLLIGRDAAPDSDEISVEQMKEEAQKRDWAVAISALFADARERGVEPGHEELVAEARLVADDAAYMNTEFAYAFELADILRGMRQRAFVFDAPPILGHASDVTVALLGQATRAYLFGLHEAAVALSRACLERALNQRVDPRLVHERRIASRLGELEAMIDVAFETGLLDDPHRETAHFVRREANNILHEGRGRSVSSIPQLAWEVLLGVRTVLSRLFET